MIMMMTIRTTDDEDGDDYDDVRMKIGNEYDNNDGKEDDRNRDGDDTDDHDDDVDDDYHYSDDDADGGNGCDDGHQRRQDVDNQYVITLTDNKND